MEFIGWFWIMWYLLLGLVVVLFWVVEFSGLLDSKNKSKRKSMWQQSRDRVHKQEYSRVYGRRSYSKGM